MNKNQALVWITIIVAVLIYSLNSVVHSKTRYVAEIEALQNTVALRDSTIASLSKNGELLTFEQAELANEIKFKKNGQISAKVVQLQNDNLKLSTIIDRYSNLKIRNQRNITKYQKTLSKMSTEEEEKLFKEEQAKLEKAKVASKKVAKEKAETILE